MSCYKIALLLWTLLLLQLVAGRTVQHRRTTINANGERETKTWISEEPDDVDSMESAGDGADGYQTFTRGGGTVRIKPSTRVIRIGGTDVPPERMIEQAKLMNGLEPVAVRQLLKTRQPVTRTSFVNGLKSTATYTLETDGSITCRIVSDVDPKEVDEAFASLWQRQKQQTQLADTQWLPEEPRPPTQVEPEQRNVHGQRQESGFGAQPQEKSTTTVRTQNNFDYPKLPEVWNPKAWPRHDPYNPPDLPVDGDDYAFPDSFDDFEVQTPRTVSVLQSPEGSGPPVRTTYKMEPNEWTRNTVKISPHKETFAQPLPEQQPPQSQPPQPQLSLTDFLRSQYEATSRRTPEADTTPRTQAVAPDHRYAPAPAADKPVRTIDIDELPVMAVLNNGQPVDEHFLRHYPSDLLPANGGRPIKTLKIDNVPRASTPDVERTKVQTITNTVTSDHVPTAADLDPTMQEILRRAGINPGEVTSAENNTITRVRVEPDGRVVKTTYRMRKMPSEETSRRFTPFTHNMPPSSTLDDEWPAMRARPTSSTRHYSNSRKEVRFPAFVPPSTTPAQPFADDDEEPLEVPKTLNPLLIHPIEAHSSGALTPATVGGGRGSHSAIEEFLAKFDLSTALLDAQRGELVKTIVDEDGRTLTVRFVLSGRL